MLEKRKEVMMAKTKLSDLESFNIRLTRLVEDHEIRLFPNALGSYTATAKKRGSRQRPIETDDFTAAKAILRLHDKVFKQGEYKNGEF